MVTKKYFLAEKVNILNRVTDRLHFRQELLKLVDQDTVILSNGFSVLIEIALQKHGVSAKVEASQLDDFRMGSLGNFAKKVAYLRSLDNFSYVTDDLAEVKYMLKQNLKGNLRQSNGLYYFQWFGPNDNEQLLD